MDKIYFPSFKKAFTYAKRHWWQIAIVVGLVTIGTLIIMQRISHRDRRYMDIDLAVQLNSWGVHNNVLIKMPKNSYVYRIYEREKYPSVGLGVEIEVGKNGKATQVRITCVDDKKLVKKIIRDIKEFTFVNYSGKIIFTIME